MFWTQCLRSPEHSQSAFGLGPSQCFTAVPWIKSLYNTKQVKLWLHHRGVRIRYTTKITVGELPQIEKRKAASAVATDFVHPLDAAHLPRTVNEAVAEGIPQ
jgi:DNA-directed RNA polymerase